MKGSKQEGLCVWRGLLGMWLAVLLPVQAVVASVTVSTLAGKTLGFLDSAGVAAQFSNLTGVAVDSTGTVYVADLSNHRIRKILADGTVSTLAGSGTAGFANGAGTIAQFNRPIGVAVDNAGTVYVAEQVNQRIRKILSDGTVSTLAGSGTGGFADGPGATAQFNAPAGVAVDSTGTVYVADALNHRIRKVLADGTVSTLAGSGTAGFVDGDGATAQFNAPGGVAVDSTGTVYVADYGNHRIRKVLADGTVSTLAGSGTLGFADGAGATAQFIWPFGVAVDSTGTVYVADYGNHRIRRVQPDGTVSTLAGSGAPGFADGAGTTAQFNWPASVAVDNTGTLYVADLSNYRIRRIVIQSHRSDFDGDGQSDMLWRDTSDGNTVIWLMNGTSRTSGGSLGVVPLAYTIAAVADYNGDGKSDILWRHTDGSTVVWLMNGMSMVAGASLGVVPGNWSVRP